MLQGAERGRAEVSGGAGSDRGRAAGRGGRGEGRGLTPDRARVAAPVRRAPGWPGLVDRSHRPARVRIRWTRRSRRGWWSCAGCTRSGVPGRLRCRLEREGVDPLPSRAAICRALVRLGLVDPRRRRRSSGPTGAGSAAGRWSCGRWTSWAGCCSPTVPELKAVTGIDDHSRFVVCGRAGRAGHLAGGLLGARRGAGHPRRARAGPDRQRQGLHRPVRRTGRSRCCSTGSAARTASSTCSPRRGHRRPPARSSASTARCAASCSTGRRFASRAGAQQAIDTFVHE